MIHYATGLSFMGTEIWALFFKTFLAPFSEYKFSNWNKPWPIYIRVNDLINISSTYGFCVLICETLQIWRPWLCFATWPQKLKIICYLENLYVVGFWKHGIWLINILHFCWWDILNDNVVITQMMTLEILTIKLIIEFHQQIFFYYLLVLSFNYYYALRTFLDEQ